MRIVALSLSLFVLIPLTASADWKKPYFGATPVGSWATYETKASAAAPSVTTSSRLEDRNGLVRLEDRTSYPGKEYPPSAQRYDLAPGFKLDRDLLDFAKSLVAYSSSTDGAAFQPMPAASIQTMKDAATAYGKVAVFVKTETVNGKECDYYTYSVRNEAARQIETGEFWLSDAVPFGLVKRTLTNKDGSGRVTWSMEQTLTDSGMTPKPAPAANTVASKEPAASKPSADKFPATAQAQNKCSASGVMGGERFVLEHCVIAFEEDSRSVTLWLNEKPILAKEADGLRVSAFAKDTDDQGKPRTMMLLAFCPGGGNPVPSATAVKRIDMGLNHAKSPLIGRQTVVRAPEDFRVEKMTGDLRLGGTLAGKIKVTMTSDGLPYSLEIDFQTQLPKQSAASGVTCR